VVRQGSAKSKSELKLQCTPREGSTLVAGTRMCSPPRDAVVELSTHLMVTKSSSNTVGAVVTLKVNQPRTWTGGLCSALMNGIEKVVQLKAGCLPAC